MDKQINLNKAFAMRVSELLLKNNISKYRLEKETGLTHSAIRYIFNEVNKDVRFSTIVKIASFFGMTLADFFDDKVFDLENLIYD